MAEDGYDSDVSLDEWFEDSFDEPHLCDFRRNGRINVASYLIALQEWGEYEEQPLPARKRRKTVAFQSRRTYEREDPKTSTWWKRYVLDSTNTWKDNSHRNGQLFMRRFCVPFTAVHEVIAKIRTPEHSFWPENPDAFGRPCAPLELLVLGAFRMVTRNSTFDDLAEATNISEDVHRRFSKVFFQWYAKEVFPKVCFLPAVEDLKTSSREYELAGIPATATSVDVVHTRLWCCSANLKNAATGERLLWRITCYLRGD
jgi:hypothetical protein